MSEGIRATVELPQPVPCPIAEVSSEADAVVDRVWSSVPPSESTAVSDFVVEAGTAPAHSACTHVMSLGDRHLLRVAHNGEAGCPCTCLGALGVPIQRYVATDGGLTLVFNAVDYDQLQTAIGQLRTQFSSLDVRRLLRSPDPSVAEDAAFVDRSQLTDRQLEVLGTAFRMGYFGRPRRANATEVAEALDVDPSTFAEHLAAAQEKVFGDVLGEAR